MNERMHETTFSLRGADFGGIAWGEGGTPTVLVHGFLDHAGSWQRTAERLPGHRVALDLRGHGRSPWAGPIDTYHVAEYVADLDALVSRLGGRVRLVGHSLGGAVASVFAGARPERVERLVIVDGLGLPDGGEEARSRMVRFLDGVAARESGHALRVFPDLSAAARRLCNIYPFLPTDWAAVLAARGTRRVEGGWAWSYDPRHLLRSPTPYRQDGHLQFLRAIRCPVLSVHPEGSLFPPENVARMESEIGDLRVVTLPGVGHMVPLQAPQALAEAIVAFLDEPERVPSRPSGGARA